MEKICGNENIIRNFLKSKYIGCVELPRRRIGYEGDPITYLVDLVIGGSIYCDQECGLSESTKMLVRPVLSNVILCVDVNTFQLIVKKESRNCCTYQEVVEDFSKEWMEYIAERLSKTVDVKAYVDAKIKEIEQELTLARESATCPEDIDWDDELSVIGAVGEGIDNVYQLEKKLKKWKELSAYLLGRKDSDEKTDEK